MKPRPQFRLRTLLIVVTLAAAASACVGREYQIVQKRKAYIMDGHFYSMEEAKPSFRFRELLGDTAYTSLLFAHHASKEQLTEARALFPEARVAIDTFSMGRGYDGIQDEPTD